MDFCCDYSTTSSTFRCTDVNNNSFHLFSMCLNNIQVHVEKFIIVYNYSTGTELVMFHALVLVIENCTAIFLPCSTLFMMFSLVSSVMAWRFLAALPLLLHLTSNMLECLLRAKNFRKQSKNHIFWRAHNMY